MRYASLDYIRGLAILLIMMAHCYGDWQPDEFSERLVVNIITVGTAFFVFISGFLFHAVYSESFHYRKFMIGKARSVLVPYFLLSLLFMTFYLVLGGEIKFPYELSENKAHDTILAVLANLLTGRTLTAYWYIPFIMLVFAASPGILKYMGLSLRGQILIVSCWFVVSMYIHRPTLMLNPFQSFLFYFPFYLFGATYSQHRARLEALSRRYVLVSLAVSFGMMIWITLEGQVGFLKKTNTFAWDGLEFLVIPHVAFIFLLLVIFQKFQGRLLNPLKYFGKVSFALFLLHAWVIALLNFTGYNAIFHGGGGFVLRTLLVLLVSTLLLEAIHAIFGKRSRMFIGY